MAEIIFNDGTRLQVEQNGTSFILDEKPEFPADLSRVSIVNDEGNQVIENAELVECASVDGRYWFTFVEISREKMLERALYAILGVTDNG